MVHCRDTRPTFGRETGLLGVDFGEHPRTRADFSDNPGLDALRPLIGISPIAGRHGRQG